MEGEPQPMLLVLNLSLRYRGWSVPKQHNTSTEAIRIGQFIQNRGQNSRTGRLDVHFCVKTERVDQAEPMADEGFPPSFVQFSRGRSHQFRLNTSGEVASLRVNSNQLTEAAS